MSPRTTSILFLSIMAGEAGLKTVAIERDPTIALDAGSLRVVESLEQTKRGGLQFKPPKMNHGRRTPPLAPSTIAVLRAHRLKQQQQRLALGLGKLRADVFVFGQLDNSPLKPATLTQAWRRAMRRVKLQHPTLKSLRHAYASALIAGDLDVLTVSRRMGHGSTALTLRVYGHLSGSRTKGSPTQSRRRSMVLDGGPW